MTPVGVDIVEIWRIGYMVERWGERFLDRVYTPQELAYARLRYPQLAARFAAKEAVMKLLGTGRWGVAWKDIEVFRERGRAPSVQLHGGALRQAQKLGLKSISISISHARDYAISFVIGEVK